MSHSQENITMYNTVVDMVEQLTIGEKLSLTVYDSLDDTFIYIKKNHDYSYEMGFFIDYGDTDMMGISESITFDEVRKQLAENEQFIIS
jgi:hypothetical protein